MNSVPAVEPADARTTTALVLAKADASAPANEDETAEIAATTRNPLWIIVAGMACFFAVAGIVMSLDTNSAQDVPPTPTPVAASSATASPDAVASPSERRPLQMKPPRRPAEI